VGGGGGGGAWVVGVVGGIVVEVELVVVVGAGSSTVVGAAAVVVARSALAVFRLSSVPVAHDTPATARARTSPAQRCRRIRSPSLRYRQRR
jgi:hypothetical protein